MDKYKSGISLIELLIALFLSTLILSSLSPLYLQMKRQYLDLHAHIERTIEVKWAMDLMAASIKRAGFTPCLTIDQLKIQPAKQGVIIHPQRLQINRMSEIFTQSLNISPQQLQIPRTFLINPKRPLLIADCEHAEILTLSDYHQGHITLRNPLKFNYPQGAFIGEWIEEQWFIAKNRQQEKSLYYKHIDTGELSPYIHAFTIEKQFTPAGKTILHLQFYLSNQEKRSSWVGVRG